MSSVKIDLNVDLRDSSICNEGKSYMLDLNVDASEQLLEDEVQVEELLLEDEQQHESNDLEGDIQVELGLQESIEPSSNSGEDIDDNGSNTQVPQAQSSGMLRRKRLTNDQRRVVYDMLLKKSVNGKLTKNATKDVASQLSIPIYVVQRIWKRAKDCGDVSHKLSNAERKRIQIDFAQIRNIPLRQRTTLASLSHALKVSKTTLYRNFKEGAIRKHSNPVKPSLKEENKSARLKFCISMLDNTTIPHDPTFVGMHNIVHIDEKWFYMIKKTENYYLLQDEEDLIRSCKSKNFITKIMFLVAQARPRFDAQGNEIFSGKIGVFPFVTKEHAKRTSANQETIRVSIARKLKVDALLLKLQEEERQGGEQSATATAAQDVSNEEEEGSDESEEKSAEGSGEESSSED
ncbi:uncharacterized protein LOC130712381 [Lotus japonicus]|uniref:uncharacterized protein LOC130712381 n=1 Tax=Lotus japonicus TaxID=34305 RepID=UPI002589935C|nr:uncharacterized protein LOC130712381 [Lotus japonicus]